MNASILLSPAPTEAIAPLQILLLEPSASDVRKILQELQAAGFVIEPTIVSSRIEFLAALESGDFDAVLSAYCLSDGDGMQALHELRRSSRDIPFILVTGALGEDSAAECVKHGVSDCVLKSHLGRLPGALRQALAERQSRTAEAKPVTTLFNGEDANHPFIENSVYGIFRASSEGAFLSANPVLLRILSCPSPQVLQSMKLSDVFRFPEHLAKLRTTCRLNGMVHSVETEWRRRDGGFVAVKLHLRGLSGPGSAGEFEGMVEDVTELRSLEHQLRLAQKFETIGELARGVAHDFNNVIGAILGWAELGFEESQAYPHIAERFARIRSQAERAAALTREFLAIGRRQALQRQSIALNSVLRKLTVFLEKVIGDNIEIEVHTHDLKNVDADPSQIEQALINLCVNARDAMPNGGRLLIESEMAHLDESFCRLNHGVLPGLYAVISVGDTGAGMAPEIRERIFEPFFTTKERGESSGMGLATAYGIVKQHGGFIHVYSEQGHGSLFRVYLPAIADATQASPKAHEPTAAPKPAGTETLLLAEDHDSIREMARQSLVGLGYRVICAVNGEEALRVCEQESPALAILDLVMPHMGGTDAALRLRERFPDLPILFASGYSETQDSATNFPHSFYLQKPYSPTALARAVRKILDPSPAVAS
jgi:two-component system, cell cycle sensor histidine kinase and response regulator CckA